MPTVVFDSSVLIPHILQASRSTRLLLRLDAADWPVATSPAILDEVAAKLRTKESLRRWLDVSDEDIDSFVTDVLPNRLRIVSGFRQVHGAVPADPDDDMIVAAALEADATYIVTEDRHLLDLHAYEGIAIMNLDQFALELDRLGVPAVDK